MSESRRKHHGSDRFALHAAAARGHSFVRETRLFERGKQVAVWALEFFHGGSSTRRHVERHTPALLLCRPEREITVSYAYTWIESSVESTSVNGWRLRATSTRAKVSIETSRFFLDTLVGLFITRRINENPHVRQINNANYKHDD